jgi:ferrochelatase
VERVGVILLHRGEPSSPLEAGAFLRRFYSDPSVYPLPLWSEAQKLLAWVRARLEQGDLAKRIDEAGGRSPLLTSAEVLAARLEDALNGEQKGTAGALFKVKVAFRYCLPGAAEAVAALKAEGISRVVGVTLYPQLCPTFLGSSTAELSTAADAGGLKLSVVDRYGEHPAYVYALKASCAATLARFDAGGRDQVTLLYSALGLDEAAVGEGDPYPSQVEATLEALTVQGGNPHRWGFHGPDSVGPHTEKALEQLAQEKAEAVAVVPLGSVVDQLDSVVELDVRLRKNAKLAGVRQYERAPALCNEPSFPAALAAIVREHLVKQAALGLGL